MKITRDDIKEMVVKTLSLITEASFNKDWLTFFNDNPDVEHSNANFVPYFATKPQQKSFIEQKKNYELYQTLSKHWDKVKDRINGIPVYSIFIDAVKDIDVNPNIILQYLKIYCEQNNITLYRNGIWTNFFNTYGFVVDFKDALPILEKMGWVHSEDLKKADGAYRKTKSDYLKKSGLRPIDIAKKWWEENSNSIKKGETNYCSMLCKKVIEFSKGFSLKDMDNNAMFMATNESPEFDDFVYLVRYINGLSVPDTTDKYLLYSIHKLNKLNWANKYMSPEYAEQYNNEFNDGSVQFDEYQYKTGDQHTQKLCALYLEEYGISKTTLATDKNIKIMLNTIKIETIYSFILKNILNRINPPETFKYLRDVLWLICYILNYKSDTLNPLKENITSRYSDKLLRSSITYAFYNKIHTEYGENINIIEQSLLNNIKSLKNNIMNLYDPFITLTQKDFYPVITTADNAMTVSLIGDSVNTPIESYIDYYETVHLLLDNVNANKYGGEEICCKDRIIDPNFTALQALTLIEQKDLERRQSNTKGRKKTGPTLKTELTTYYQNDTLEVWSFFDLLVEESNFKDKTQRDIFNFLNANSIKQWGYEYNRYEREDEDLGGKSVDMYCEHNGKTYAIEYQGEQHFRPNGVKPKDEDKYEGSTITLKRLILMKFKSKFNSNNSNITQLKYEFMPIIYGELLKFAQKYTYDKIFIELYNWLLSYKDNITDLFDYETSKKCPEYIFSPKRFLEEINVWLGQQRDIDKAKTLQNKGWFLSYILPGSTTISKNDENFAKSIKGVTNVFKWNADGRKKIQTYLQEIGLNNTINESLFATIVKELGLIV
jgi:hypothetical protein